MQKEGTVPSLASTCLAQLTWFEVGAAILVSSVNYDPKSSVAVAMVLTMSYLGRIPKRLKGSEFKGTVRTCGLKADAKKKKKKKKKKPWKQELKE